MVAKNTACSLLHATEKGAWLCTLEQWVGPCGLTSLAYSSRSSNMHNDHCLLQPGCSSPCVSGREVEGFLKIIHLPT